MCPPQDDKPGGEREVEGGTIGEGAVDDWTTRNISFSFVINLVIGCTIILNVQVYEIII